MGAAVRTGLRHGLVLLAAAAFAPGCGAESFHSGVVALSGSGGEGGVGGVGSGSGGSGGGFDAPPSTGSGGDEGTGGVLAGSGGAGGSIGTGGSGGTVTGGAGGSGGTTPGSGGTGGSGAGTGGSATGSGGMGGAGGAGMAGSGGAIGSGGAAGTGGAPAVDGCDRKNWVFTADPACNTAECPRAIDGDLSTRYASGRGQGSMGAENVVLTFPKVITISGVTLTTSSPNDWPAAYLVEHSMNGTTFAAFTPPLTGTGSANLVITFPPRAMKAIRVTQTGMKANWWSIHEMTVASCQN